MPDNPLYDPDRDVPEDLDFSNPEVANAYLDHPTTGAFHDDIRRQFLSLPPADQQRELARYVSGLEAQRAQAATDLESLDRDAPGRSFLQEMLDMLDKNIESAKLQMLELDG